MKRAENLWRIAVTACLVTAFIPVALRAQTASDVAAVVQDNSQLAFDMYHRLRTSDTVADDDGNLIFSPYSISTAIGMVYAGARGQTADEIADVFRFGLSPDRLHAAYGSLIQKFNGDARDGYELAVANRLWGQQGFDIHQPFLDTTRNHYGAELGRLDFVRDTENARLTINQWVEDQTNNRIKDLIPSGGVNQSTRMVLTNAIYFLGDWKRPFSPDSTMDRPFAVSDTAQIRAPTMFQNGRFRYADGGDFQLLELPYKGDELSMLVVLPKAGGRAGVSSSTVGGVPQPQAGLVAPADATTITLGTGGGAAGPITLPTAFSPIPPSGFAPGPIGLKALTALEALDPHSLQTAIDNLTYRDVDVFLPKFKLETSVTLRETLSDMGMPTAFSDAADFLNISDVPLSINQVRHKAFIEVDEEGTEAAAATSIEMVLTTAIINPPPPILFNADHPFQFLIRDNVTGSTLFMGRVARPEGEITAVPEPASMVLAVVASGCLAFVTLRCRKSKTRCVSEAKPDQALTRCIASPAAC